MILPSEMKDLMNRVAEAKKAAEANLISRREETAAMRSQANTAKLLADNSTLIAPACQLPDRPVLFDGYSAFIE